MIQDLQLCMELDAISQVEFHADYQWHLVAKCANCDEIFQDLFCRASETESIPNSRGEANCVVKCKLCQRHGYIKIRSRPDQIIYNSNHSGNFITLSSFDCRGIELMSWIPDSDNNQITARGLSSNAIYHNIDLNEEFFEYDEGAGVPVSITEIRQRFITGK